MKSKLIYAFIFFVLLLIGIKSCQILTMQQGWMPSPDAIHSAVAKVESWNDSITTVGSVSAIRGVTIAAENEGKIVKIAAESGSQIQEGDLIIQIDTSVEEAQLNSALARENLAQVNFTRAERLLKSNGVSKAEYDAAVAEIRTAKADVELIRAILNKKNIKAPFAGQLGIRKVNVGQFVSPGTELIPLQTLDTVYVDLELPQRAVSKVKPGQKILAISDSYPDQKFEGKLLAINPNLEIATRTLSVRAEVANSDQKLLPGMFVNVEVIFDGQTDLVVIPKTAISYAPYGDSVFIVEDLKSPDGKMYKGVTQHFVSLGPAKGDFVAITKGLKAGQEVATSAVFKLKNGSAVTIDNSKPLEASLSPKVEES